MRRVDSIEDEMRGVASYLLADGRMIKVDARHVREYGLKFVMERFGVAVNGDPVPVFQDGRQIGTVPYTFDPLAVKSTSMFYDPRPGDFVRKGDHWEASRMMCPGDFEAVPGFKWAPQSEAPTGLSGPAKASAVKGGGE